MTQARLHVLQHVPFESTAGSVKALVVNRREEIVEGPYVQGEAEILSLRQSAGGINAIMDRLLDGLAENAEGPQE